MEKIKLGDLCNPSQGQIKEQPDTIIDYIDISSVDNVSKTVTGYQTMAFGESPSRARKSVKKGNILVSTVRPNLNAVAILEKDTPNLTVASTGFCILDCKENADNRFVFNFCKSKTFIDAMVSQATGASYPAVTDKIVRAALVPLYSYHEQRSIGEVLDKVSAIIEKRKRELVELDDLIKARFIEMFGDPVVNDRGWQKITLLESLEAGRTVTYGIVQTGDEFENGTPVFRPIDIAGGHVPKREELKKTDPLISAQYKRTLLKGNELLITVRGSVGETFQTTDEFKGCNVGRNIVPLVTDSNKVLQRFLQELFAQDAIKNWLKGITKGIALQGLNMGEFKEMPVIVPPIAMQRAFVVFAMQVDKSKVAA